MSRIRDPQLSLQYNAIAGIFIFVSVCTNQTYSDMTAFSADALLDNFSFSSGDRSG